jgi:hypothetical protein
MPKAVPNQVIDWQKHESESIAPHHGDSLKQDRICGVTRRLFWIFVCATLVLVIGSILGVTIGLLPRQVHQDTSSSPSTGTANILSNSSLSAINFTDPTGYGHRVVFFEDGYNAIVARHWDEQNRTWAKSNVTLVLSNSPTPVKIAPGAALAAAGVGTQVDLFVVDPGGMIRSLYNNDFTSTPDYWQNYTMNDTLRVYPGSRLSAALVSCDNRGSGKKCSCYRDFCNGGCFLAFQRPRDGAIVTTNYTSDWAGRQTAVNGFDATPGTSLELVMQYQGDPGVTGLISQRYMSGTAGAIQATGYEDHAWDPWNCT